MKFDATLEEMWRIKREIASEYPTLEAYFNGMLAFQEAERKRGVKFVSFEPRRPDHTEQDHALSVAEGGHPYDGSAPGRHPPPLSP